MEDPYAQIATQALETNEAPRKRTYEESNDVGSDGKLKENVYKRSSNNRVTPLLKLLVPNYAAGALIGKGGSNIAELQKRYGGRIRLSPSHEYYPGTDERIAIITGEISQIIDLNDYIIDKVQIDQSANIPGRPKDETRSLQVKIVLTNATAGLVIGRNGATIKSLQEESKAKIMISSRDDSLVPGERILTITGNTEQRTEAARQVINKVAIDAENATNRNLTYSSRNMNQNHQHDGPNQNFGRADNHFGGKFPALDTIIGNLQQKQQHQQSHKENLLSTLAQNPLAALQQFNVGNDLGNIGHLSQIAQQLGLNQHHQGAQNVVKTTVQIQMEIPEILVGPIMGPQAKNIQEFIQFSGAKIQLSPKSDFTATPMRVLTIYGDLNQTQVAYYLVNEKISQAGKGLTNMFNMR